MKLVFNGREPSRQDRAKMAKESQQARYQTFLLREFIPITVGQIFSAMHHMSEL
jgi:hypothetical protein